MVQALPPGCKIVTSFRYIRGTGRYQQECDKILSNMKNEVKSNNKWDWRAPDKKHWALLNAAAGLYHGFYNDGDNAESAVNHRRAHGFDHIHDLKVFAKRMGANHLVVVIPCFVYRLGAVHFHEKRRWDSS